MRRSYSTYFRGGAQATQSCDTPGHGFPCVRSIAKYHPNHPACRGKPVCLHKGVPPGGWTRETLSVEQRVVQLEDCTGDEVWNDSLKRCVAPEGPPLGPQPPPSGGQRALYPCKSGYKQYKCYDDRLGPGSPAQGYKYISGKCDGGTNIRCWVPKGTSSGSGTGTTPAPPPPDTPLGIAQDREKDRAFRESLGMYATLGAVGIGAMGLTYVFRDKIAGLWGG